MAFAHIRETIDSIMRHDPAARSRLEIFLCYPGFHALLYHRLTHWLWERDLTLFARFMSNFGKIMTGIEIHPGATIGRRVFIDHGTGVVIGETAEIGDDVTLYQGVTLGGTSLDKGKRHPTLENGVIVGSGAQVLGPLTVGENARIGANAVVLKDVPAGATMVGIPARIVMGRDKAKKEEFTAYGTPTEDLPDPVARGLDSLRSQLVQLSERIEQLEGRAGRREDKAETPETPDEDPSTGRAAGGTA